MLPVGDYSALGFELFLSTVNNHEKNIGQTIPMAPKVNGQKTQVNIELCATVIINALRHRRILTKIEF